MKFRLKSSSDQVSGFLDKGTNMTGELEFAGTLRIDGNFHGSISTGDVLIIGEHALVHADIHTPVLVTSPGSVLDGRIEMAGGRPDETTVAAHAPAQQQRSRQERD